MSLHFSWACLICPPLILPRGSGQKQKLKVASAGDKDGKPPLGTAVAGRTSDQKGKPPTGHSGGSGCQCRKRFDTGVPGAEPPAK